MVRGAPVDPGGNLSPDEVGTAFSGLSADDKQKLHAVEAVYRGGTRFRRGELIYEAVCRTLVGDRHCPRSVPLMAFLVQTMRSIAHHDRNKARRTTSLTVVPRQGDALDGLIDYPSDQLTPEEHMIEQQAVDTVSNIHGRFDDDVEAQLVLMGWADDLRGKELREATGLDQAALDYAIKRIRSRMRKLSPNGWTP